MTRFVFIGLILSLAACGKESPSTPQDKSSTPVKTGPSKSSGGGFDQGSMTEVLWNRAPKSGEANLHFVLKENGQPFKGKKGMQGQFKMTLSGLRKAEGYPEEEEHYEPAGRNTTQAFNPDGQGRFVYDGLEPGLYKVEIKDMEGGHKTWLKENVTVEAGKIETFTVDLTK